ncbi:5,6-dimethylbenzimidazole synthase [Entomobacter blattae]|uniref:5,6-dimethylbenzimidazole synthase n=1 Tax=Entomobacter blattae TaxID=2762277 RepID=A0A7H1NQ41_9PROT|nr:5,6-dimethylbenzimidazole synthase [Entomobacter blattae]QNT77901.1 5,6-dimethylbenzimidazole synthase [Entomobacter blattae]
MTVPVFTQEFQKNLEELLYWRRDVRHFLTTPLDPALLDYLLALANTAPSVGLSQPWRFMKVESKERRLNIRAEFERCNAEALSLQTQDDAPNYAQLKLAGLDDAPHHLAVFSEKNPSQGRGLGRHTMPETAAYSTVMAIYTFWLAARAHGVGVGWVSILDPHIVSQILDSKPEWQFIAYLCVGKPKIEQDIPELEEKGWEYRREEWKNWIER